jgi:[histone H3]-lysine27 N-methyltransferase
VDFFKIQRGPAAAPEVKKRKRKPAGPLLVSKKKRRLLPFNPSEDPAQRLRQMASLATALTATGAVFSNHLTYVPGMAPRSANRAALEAGGMQVRLLLLLSPRFDFFLPRLIWVLVLLLN